MKYINQFIQIKMALTGTLTRIKKMKSYGKIR